MLKELEQNRATTFFKSINNNLKHIQIITQYASRGTMIYRSVKKTDGVRVPILGQVENFMENYQGHSLASASPNAGVQRFEKKFL